MEKQTNSPKLRFPEFKGEWEKKKLGEVAEKIGDGLHGTPIYSDNSDIYFINGNNLTNGKIEINENTKKVDVSIFEKNNKGLNQNTLLISINGTIGNIAKYNNEKVMLGKSVGYFNFKENTNFYYHIFHTYTIQNYFISELTGSTIKNLSLKTLRETEISFPTLPEQTKIAEFFTAIDVKIQTLKTKKEKLQQYKKGVMQQIFSQELRFKDEKGEDFPEWKDKKLVDVSLTNYQGINTAADKTIYYPSGYPILQAKHITSEEINYDDAKYVSYQDYNKYKEKYKPEVNEILISNIGTLGKIVLIENDVEFLVAWNIFKVKLNLNISNPKFVSYVLKNVAAKGYFQEVQSGNATKFVNKTEMLGIPIQLPTLPEQTKIANFLSTIDEKIKHTETQIQQTQTWKKGLLQKMFV